MQSARNAEKYLKILALSFGPAFPNPADCLVWNSNDFV
jgi:hypothetical protein